MMIPKSISPRPQIGGLGCSCLGGRGRMTTTKTPEHGKHTGYNLWSLEVLIWMNVAGRNSKVESHCQQEEVGTSPHDRCPSHMEIRHEGEIAEDWGELHMKVRDYEISILLLLGIF